MRADNAGWMAFLGTLASWIILFLVGFGAWACPRYNVWERGLAGEAELRQAEWNRQIAVQEAKAKEEAAQMLAEAEVRRAEGVAKANKIIGDSLQGNEDYLRYLWVQSLGQNAREVIYVPTEANLPILEASRMALGPPVKGK